MKRLNWLYLSGPMTGIPQHNCPLFNKETKRLRKRGYKVVNPAELDGKRKLSWEECLRRDITYLVKCESVAFLPGWKDSKGATLEIHIAKKLNMPIHSVEYYINRGNYARKRTRRKACKTKTKA